MVISNIDLNDLKDKAAEAYKSTEMTAKWLFPDRFNRPFSSMHKEIFAALDDPKEQKVVIAAPRGVGKTSIVQLAYPAKRILFRDCRFLVTVSKSATSAIMQSENLKANFVSSPIINNLFGSMKSSRWARDMWMVDWDDVPYSTLVLPRGSGQQVRGVLHGDYRPDLVIVDDFEDDEEVLSEDQRKKKRDWFFGSLVNVIDRGNKDWKLVYIDTVKHEDCLLVHLLDDPSWTSFEYAIGDEHLKSNWPEFISDEALKQLRDEAKDSGALDKFYMEYYNQPISTEEAGFKQEYYKYYSEGSIKFDFKRKHEGFVIVDPAKSVNPKSAHTAILGGCVDRSANRVYYRDLIDDMLHPHEIINAALDMCARMNSRILAVEVTGLNEFITFPYKNEIARRGLNLEFISLNPRGKKSERAKSLIHMYRLGQIYHNDSGAMEPLEQQQMSFPRPKRWDSLDVASYVVELLEKGLRYFMPLDMDEDDEVSIEREYADLPEDDYADYEDNDWIPSVTFL